jgi:NTP pyrophosphatase (non-canonical NTP hydrolase)
MEEHSLKTDIIDLLSSVAAAREEASRLAAEVEGGAERAGLQEAAAHLSEAMEAIRRAAEPGKAGEVRETAAGAAGAADGSVGEIRELILRYYRFRGLSMPNEMQAFLFLASEVGELADALVSAPGPTSGGGKWVRNNPDRERDPADEAADVLMMLYVTMMERGIDPYAAMRAKFRRKGFNGEA